MLPTQRDIKKYEIFNDARQIWMLAYVHFTSSTVRLAYLKKNLKKPDLVLSGSTHLPTLYSSPDDDGYYVIQLKSQDSSQGVTKTFFRSKVFQDVLLLKTKLDEKRKDTKHLGRAISYSPNAESRSSPLSTDNIKKQNYRGLLNLAVILLVVTQFRAALENILEFGFVFFTDDSAENKLNYRNSKPALVTHLAILVPTLFSFSVEKYMAPVSSLPRILVFALIFLNQTVLIGMAVGVVLHYDTHPLVAVSLLMLASTLSLKTLSFHHFWHDVRFYVREEKKLRTKQRERNSEEDKTKVTSLKKKRKLSWGEEEWFADLSEDSEAEEKTKSPILPKLPKKQNFYGLSEEIFTLAIPSYPKNVTLQSYSYFLAAPTLCFQLKYPRSDKCRIAFVIKRSIELGVTTMLMFFLIQQSVLPITGSTVSALQHLKSWDLLEKILRLQMQYVGVWILMFYSFFHCFLNIAAELLYFGDRQFYRDWWNSNSLEEYWKEWNIPVHSWALRHIYYPMRRRNISRFVSNVTVFFVSAVFHELIIAFSFKMYYFLAFTAMMSNVPLILIQTKLKPYLENSQLNNVFFWLLFCFIGHPVAIMIYHWGYLASTST